MRGDGPLSRAWREARRRRLPGTLLGYPVGAWFLIEAVPQVLGYLGADPERSERVGSAITILALAAFPLVLLLTWIFQVVPQDRLPRDSDEGPRRRHHLLTALSVVLVSAGCVTLATLMWPPVSGATERPWWSSRPPDPHALALLPGQVLLGDDVTRQVVDCLVHRLTDRLAADGALVVRGPQHTERLADTRLPMDTLASRLGVGLLVGTTAEAFPEGVHLTLRLLDRSGRQVGSVQAWAPTGPDARTYDALTDSLELRLREAVGAALGRSSVATDLLPPGVEGVQEQAEDELARYRRLLEAGDVDGALGALGRADVILSRLADTQPRWPAPRLRQAWIGQQRALLLLTHRRSEAVVALRGSLAHADDALDRAPGDAEALRLRGRAALRLASTDTSASADREGLLASAEADLRRSQARHRDRAQVRFDLALVKREQGQAGEALAFARDAYEHDPFLALADRVLTELFELSFRLSRDADANAWCAEARRRFPDAWTSQACHLTLMGWGVIPADTVLASALTARALAAYPPALRGVLRPQLETLAAAVRAQAGDTAGARAVVELTPLAAPPAVQVTAAGVWLLLRERDQALARLRAYLARAPGEARQLRGRRILAGLEGDPRFTALLEGRRDP